MDKNWITNPINIPSENYAFNWIILRILRKFDLRKKGNEMLNSSADFSWSQTV